MEFSTGDKVKFIDKDDYEYDDLKDEVLTVVDIKSYPGGNLELLVENEECYFQESLNQFELIEREGEY